MARRGPEGRAEATARRAAVDDPATVLDAAARFLEVRPRSVAEVRRRLGDAGYRTDLVDGAIERLVELGMLDDEAFARAWIESRDRARPRGAWALRDELRRKGLAPEIVAAVIEEREAAPDAPAVDGRVSPGHAPNGVTGRPGADRNAAARLLERRGAALARERDPRKRRARAYALLARNGFDPDVCREAVAAWEASEPAG